MAVPKRKSSKARKNKRRSNVWKISAPAFSKCPNCGALTVPHRVCKNCGFYKGREVIKMDPEVNASSHCRICFITKDDRSRAIPVRLPGFLSAFSHHTAGKGVKSPEFMVYSE